MKYPFFVLLSFCLFNLYGQGINLSTDPLRGPVNTLPGGIIDGVVLTDEVPIRSKVDYEHVRAADYVWSKRVFSRIDARERLNHDIFFPLDSFSFTFNIPMKREDLASDSWNRNQTRLSLWTIISRHIMNGDLTVYAASSPIYKEAMDGYSLKYPILKKTRDDFFNENSYRSAITNNIVAARGPSGPYLFKDSQGQDQGLVKTDLTFDLWLDSIKNSNIVFQDIDVNKVEIKEYWDVAKSGEDLMEIPTTIFIASESIIAYYVKEDWYFDKERSILDKRIIAIAPVVSFEEEKDTPIGALKTVVMINNGEKQKVGPKSAINFQGQSVEREMFWLYFDELRNVLVNYYVYNDKNDAQWMSFDDLFWKRKYAATIYKVSDKFDREIEDYKFGVEALYEAERVKESIRDWEHDLWNY